jgi:mono/diheme cytochrome c family protein
VIARGLRQPFIGVHPRSGTITSSDQQGHYVPSTPLHIIRSGGYYGFIPTFLPKDQYPAPIEEPLTWIPHVVNASAAGQVWLADAKMGPLNDALIHLGYNRPEMFVVRIHERGSKPQAAVMSLKDEIPYGLLAGAVHPRDGNLYVTGFKVWGTSATRISGLGRLRYTGAPFTMPREIVAMDKGLLVQFDLPIDEAAASPGNFAVQRWNYKRSSQYGSPHLRLDGKPGQELMIVSSVYLSRDRKSLFLGIPDMKPVMQMTLHWSLATGGKPFSRSAAFTPDELIPFEPTRDGFAPIQVDLTARSGAPAATAVGNTEVSVAEGQKLYAMFGCVACHSIDGTLAGKVGPSWRGLAGAKRELIDGSVAVADEAYLREAILKPSAKVPKGFEKLDAGMPIYEGVLNDAQIKSLILYIQSLGELKTTSAQ